MKLLVFEFRFVLVALVRTFETVFPEEVFRIPLSNLVSFDPMLFFAIGVGSILIFPQFGILCLLAIAVPLLEGAHFLEMLVASCCWLGAFCSECD